MVWRKDERSECQRVLVMRDEDDRLVEAAEALALARENVSILSDHVAAVIGSDPRKTVKRLGAQAVVDIMTTAGELRILGEYLAAQKILSVTTARWLAALSVTEK